MHIIKYSNYSYLSSAVAAVWMRSELLSHAVKWCVCYTIETEIGANRRLFVVILRAEICI